ncbi:bifunctional ornithine acetyltransferase/N-acetylglutamate synthase [Fusibacter ferrireducens]|uniref:Arginine biosynthesis bifunctional protein ArgJ n=1 Tax=Fusibacter ferrireducens TaxID=2785058 RepID=A0ABR9ZXP5_9FIRM|nr:bifunctional ornithine acetyltransferase/N-acetylglutamate synthase [Fusibacter ferrireducens]MBF4695240.1 bifunctional ornithine acetyltransferase/N-acetylglutamate synthase [Fusibacter ferrireducens]
MFKEVKGHINTPKGFLAGGLHAGIKKKKKDLALIYTEAPANLAGVFTTNQVKAAPVLWNQEILHQGKAVHAVVINSGNANACTGVKGISDNAQMAKCVAEKLDCDAEEVLVASTGIIGLPLPMDVVEEGIKTLAGKITSKSLCGKNAAEAIMTTDTFSKEVCVEVMIKGEKITISGMSKGSGMIHPNMATMLSFVTTDANVAAEDLQALLAEINEDTYNMISVDGDTSTNDMVIVLANGAAMSEKLTKDDPDFSTFKKAFLYVHQTLAKLIVKDGEGASKLIEVTVTGAESTKDAKKIVKSVLTSSLVKTAFFGEDANWGRILCAAGYAGVNFDPLKVGLSFSSDKGSLELLSAGEPVAFSEALASEVLSEKEIYVHLSLGTGHAKAVGWGCDLSYEYVKINGDYRT